MKNNLNSKKTDVEYKKFIETINNLRREQKIILKKFSQKAETKKINKIKEQLSKSTI